MAKYYYEKYAMKNVYSNYRDESSWTPIETINAGQRVWSGYEINGGWTPQYGYVQVPPLLSFSNLDPNVIGKILYRYGGQNSSMYETKYLYRDGSNNMWVEQRSRGLQYDTNLVKGNHIETIEAEDGTYPENGQEGNYWYIKKGLVFPELKLKINGEIKTSEYGWVKIDGQLKEIDRMWTKIDGVIKEI